MVSEGEENCACMGTHLHMVVRYCMNQRGGENAETGSPAWEQTGPARRGKPADQDRLARHFCARLAQLHSIKVSLSNRTSSTSASVAADTWCSPWAFQHSSCSGSGPTTAQSKQNKAMELLNPHFISRNS